MTLSPSCAGPIRRWWTGSSGWSWPRSAERERMAAGNIVQGALFTVMVVRAAMLRDPAFEKDLAQQIARSPRFFQNAPVVLDLRGVENLTEANEFETVKDKLRSLTLTLVGVQNAQPAQLEGATAAGLASFAPNAASQPRGGPAASPAAIWSASNCRPIRKLRRCKSRLSMTS